MLRKIVEIKWLDTTASASWTSIKKVKKLTSTRVLSVGYVVCENETEITLAESITEDGDCGYNIIPKGAIIARREIK